MDFTTPALLFPAISLILLAYTNRFLGLSSVIRHLYDQYQQHPSHTILQQIHNLRLRVRLVRNMQIVGVVGMLLCVISIILLFWRYDQLGMYSFAASLLCLFVSLSISVYELFLSGNALNILLAGMEQDLSRMDSSLSLVPRRRRRRSASVRPSDDPL